MRRFSSAFVLITSGLLATSAAQATGRAEVRYVAPDRFTDAGFGAVERERTQSLLTRQIEKLATRLPDGQVLKVEFTDVDLAGEFDWLSPHRLRVMGQLPDAPRLALRFELTKDGQVVARGEEQLRDMSYLVRRSGLKSSDPLPYESRMLSEWFSARFASAR